MTKIGRPPSKNPLKKHYIIRVTEKLHNKLIQLPTSKVRKQLQKLVDKEEK